jgi:hypothetical protein
MATSRNLLLLLNLGTLKSRSTKPLQSALPLSELALKTTVRSLQYRVCKEGAGAKPTPSALGTGLF